MPNLAPPPILVGRFRLVFDWRGDRFGHRLLFAASTAGDRRQRTLLESVEGKPDEAWPASPVLQEFHCETREEGRIVALLVGRAGKSHWSLSVLCDPPRERLLFEAACRFGQSPRWLGSRYVADSAPAAIREPGDQNADRTDRRRTRTERTRAEWTRAERAGESGVLLSRADGGTIRSFAGDAPGLAQPPSDTPSSSPERLGDVRLLDGRCMSDPPGPIQDRCSQGLSLAAIMAPAGDGPRTVCWSYRIGAA